MCSSDLILLCLVFASPAAAAMYDNKADCAGYKAKIKRDIFYTEEEAAAIKNIIKQQQQAAAPPVPVPIPVQQQAAVPVSPQSAVLPQPVFPAPDSSPVEIFNVEGIIKMGDRGCAIINSKLWFVGKPDQGYEVIKLHPEAVEIKTPGGKILKCKLTREK